MNDTRPPIADIGQWIKLTGEGWRKNNPATSWLDGPTHGTIVQVTGYQDADYATPGTDEPMFMWKDERDEHPEPYAASRDTQHGDWRYDLATDEEVRAYLGVRLDERISALRDELAQLERLKGNS